MSEAADYPIVVVRWADAHTSEGGWLTLDDHEDDGECIITSCGYMIPADEPGGKKDHVALWQTVTGGEGIHGFFVPVAMVRSIQVVTGNTDGVSKIGLDTPPA